MELGSVFFGLAIVVLVAAYVLRPITGKGPLRRWREYPSSLQAERERLLEAIQELDFDYSLGKVLEQDYRPQRQALATQGAQVLRRIDELNGDSEGQSSLDRELEAAVVRLRTGSSGQARFCHQCGSQVLPSDRFCSTCGAAQGEPRG